MWDLESKNLLRRYPAGEDNDKRNVQCLLPDGKRFITGGWERLALWSVDTEARQQEYTGFKYNVGTAATFDEGRRLIATCGHGTLNV